MADIVADVGVNAKNNTHDVALVQAMLRVIKKNNTSYLGGNYDGVYGPQTKTAINKFQNDYNLVSARSIDKAGHMMPNGETLNKMNVELPNAYNTVRIIENTKTVYLAGNAKDAAASQKTITNKPDLDNTFRAKVGQLVQTMYKAHKIVLNVTANGWRRSFAEQATLHRNNPRRAAGPGHSNHQYGRAVDIGLNGFEWLEGNGTIVQDNWWLSKLDANHPAKATAMWDARDAIALKAPISLHRLNMERIHLQSYNQRTTSPPRSLAALLNLVGTMSWSVNAAGAYSSNLGGGKQQYPVGSALQIWDGKSTVSKASLAKATGVPVTKITNQDIGKMKNSLKGDFQLADQHWRKWQPVP